MGTKVIRIALAAIVFVLAAGAWAWPQQSEQLEEPETLVYRLGEQNIKTLDRGRAGPSRGDRLYVRAAALDDQGEVAVNVLAVCEFFTKNRLYCENENNIEGRGELLASGFQNLRDPAPIVDPILGGTGEFRNARGQVTVDFAGGTITFELLP